jgi:ABC-type nitrate/sulfonate/bicarbonate transport system substrate-binding protein
MIPRLLLAVLLGLASVRAAEPVPITFQLDWKPNVQFAGLILARERGWYREAGLDVTLLPIPPDEAVVSNVVAHPNWIGCAESGVLLGARARGAPIRVVGTMLQGTPMCLMSLHASRIRRPSQLAGKRLGLHSDGNDAIDFVLRKAGLDRQKVRVEIMPYDTTPLLEGKFDVVQGYAVDEAVELELAGHQVDLMYFHDHGYAAYGQAYFTSEAFLRDRPDLVRRFLEVSNRGWKAAAKERDAVVELVVTKTLPGTDRQHQRRALDTLVPLLTREGGRNSHGRMRRATWEKAVADYNHLPVAPRPLTVDELVVFDLLR